MEKGSVNGMGSRTGENWKLRLLPPSPFMDYLNSRSLGLLICKTMLDTVLPARRLWQELNRQGCEDISSVVWRANPCLFHSILNTAEHIAGGQ